jgi:hypothetical protein
MTASSRWHVPLLILLPLLAAGTTHGQDKKPNAYTTMAPVEQYQIANRETEIALARTAAPPSVSAEAEILVLGSRGYETAIKGTNGFVCFVERSWSAGFGDPEFWNPKLRAPNCFNPPAVHSVLPQYMKRTEWVMAGDTRQQVIDKARAAYANHQFGPPDAGSISLMLSKNGYLSDAAAGPWLPHVMFFVPTGQAATWAAGLEGSPVIGADASPVEPTVLIIPVRRWSDGSAAPAPTPTHSTHSLHEE